MFTPFSLRLSKEDRKKAAMESGDQIFVWRATSELWIFLVFYPDRTQEVLAVDVAWSARGRFPWDIARPTAHEREKAMALEEGFLGFSDLLNFVTGSGIFFGWPVWRCSVEPTDPNFTSVFIAEDLLPVSEREAEDRVCAAASAAVSDVAKYAMPFVASLIEDKASRV